MVTGEGVRNPVFGVVLQLTRHRGFRTLGAGNKSQLLMKLNAPHTMVFLLSLILTGLAVVDHYKKLPFVSAHPFGFFVVGYALLVLACLIPRAKA